MSKETEVIIVGGGIAGLSAAGQLTKSGIKNVILEAGGKLGGRMRTQTEGLQSGVLELGAQWIHGGCPANSLFNYCISRNLLGGEVRRKSRYHSSPTQLGYTFTKQGIPIDKAITEKAWELYELINAEVEEGSNHPAATQNKHCTIRQFYDMRVDEEMEKLEPEYKHDKEEIRQVLESLSLQLASYLGDSLEESSLDLYSSESVELPGGDVIVPAGVNTIIDSLAKEAKPGQEPQTYIDVNVTVDKIIWDARGVTVEALRGDTRVVWRGDHAIVTVPLGVLQHQPQLFSPVLNQEKLSAISVLRAGRVSKVFLEFEQSLLEPHEPGLRCAPTKKDFETGGRLPEAWPTFVDGFHRVEGQPRFLLMWVCGEAASVVDNLKDSEVLAGATDLLRRITGDPGLSAPIRLHRHRWLVDPLARGTWSYPSDQATSQDLHALMVPCPSVDEPRLLLAGEHTHPLYWSFMHGARLSGIEQANRIITFRQQSGEDKKK